MTGPGFFESGGAFDKGSNLIIGIVSILAAFFMVIEYLSSKSDYEQYCTGLTGLFVEAFSGGQCSDLELYMYLTGAGSVFCGLCGFIFIIIGLQSSPKNQPQVILVPQYAVQQPQQYAVQQPQQYAVQQPQQYAVQQPQQTARFSEQPPNQQPPRYP